MSGIRRIRLLTAVCAAVVLVAAPRIAVAQTQDIDDRVAAIKSSLEASQATLKQYEWIETTVVSLKGEEKSRKQERCYYGADGKLQRLEVSSTPEEKSKRGLRGKAAEAKKAEISEYMKSAVALLKSYVPPDPRKLQASKDAGKVSIEILEPNKRVRLNFKDYQQPGDNLGIEIDFDKSRLLGLSVATYLADPKDAVTQVVRMGQLADGTPYTSDVTLDAKAQEVNVVVQYTGYKKLP